MSARKISDCSNGSVNSITESRGINYKRRIKLLPADQVHNKFSLNFINLLGKQQTCRISPMVLAVGQMSQACKTI